MDLIYMNSDLEDLGMLLDYEIDMAFGQDENNFECGIATAAHCCEAGFYLYMEGTEYGGIIDSIESNNEQQEVIYSGRTWHGILNSKVIEPDSGQAYLTLSGEANAVIASLLSRLSLTDIFEASTEDSGFVIRNYKMNRYIAGYDGIIKMLASVGARVQIAMHGGKVIVSAVAKKDYTQDEEFDSDLVDFKIRKNYKTVNHLICLGSGELTERMVVHLYADTQGNISQEQTQFGLDEYATVFDYPNTESEEELIRSGTEELKALWEPASLSVDFDADSDAYYVGDTVGACDNVTKISVAAVITKKIVTIKNGQTTISYKVGE
jgi:hypothetical protein